MRSQTEEFSLARIFPSFFRLKKVAAGSSNKHKFIYLNGFIFSKKNNINTNMSNEFNPIAVTVITGFLGAGKTSLLNQIISQHPNTRFAIIENEFGEIGIDNDLVIGAEDGIFEMSNGCICCSLSSELTSLLLKLYARREEFSHLLIETTGIADPSSVAAAFITEPKIQDYFRLDAILCMVDSKHIENNLIAEKETARQIGFADVLIFNKKDLVSTQDLERVQTYVKNINPTAKVLSATEGQVDTTPLLQLDAFDPSIVEKNFEHIHHNHDHQHGHITSQSYTFEQDFDLLKFRHFVQVLLMFQNMRIYRMKGILRFADQDHRIIFQSVQQQTVFRKGSKWQEGEKKESRLVVIGNGLNRKMFDKKLRECLVN